MDDGVWGTELAWDLGLMTWVSDRWCLASKGAEYGASTLQGTGPNVDLVLINNGL